MLTDEATAKHKTVNVGDAVLVASERNGLFVAKIKALYATGNFLTFCFALLFSFYSSYF